MRKLSFIIAVILVVFFATSVHAKIRKSKSGLPTTYKALPIPLRSTAITKSLGTPTVYIGAEYIKKSDSLKVIFGEAYYKDDFNEMLYSNDSIYNNINRTNDSIKLNYSTFQQFYELDSALSTVADPIVITNTGVEGYAFGGMFYALDLDDTLQPDSIVFSFNDGEYIYKHFCPNDSSFIAFKFPTDTIYGSIYNVTITADQSSLYYPVANSLVWGGKKVVTALKEAKNSKVCVYPNPTSEGIYINASGKLIIFNGTGSIVLTQEIRNESYISLSNLPKGIYFVQIATNEGLKLEKIIKK